MYSLFPLPGWAEFPAVPAAPLHPHLADGKRGVLIILCRASMRKASHKARNWVKVCPVGPLLFISQEES